MSSILGSSSNTTTTNNAQNSASTSGTTSGSSTPTFSSGLQALMDQLSGYASSSITNPSAQLKPIQNAGLDQINESYAAAPQAAATQLASRGYGSSGATGSTLYNLANAKAGAQSSFNGQIANDAVQQGQFGASLANQLLNTGKGTSSTASTSGTSSGTSSAQGTSDTTQTPSILSGISSLASLLAFGGGGGLFGGGSGDATQGGSTGIPVTTPYAPNGPQVTWASGDGQ